HHPRGEIAPSEVAGGRSSRERVEAQIRICSVEAGLAAIAPDRLVPGLVACEADPRAVVLRAALEAPRVTRVDREALELQRRQVPVQVVERRRDARQELLAIGEIDGIQPA